MAAGQLRYANDHESAATSYYLLRRNIHRLEKGLIMRPRRAVFATDFVEETLRIYVQAVNRALKDGWNSELAWAQDVLTDYFAVVDRQNPIIAAAYAQFITVESGRSGQAAETLRRVPYMRDTSEPPVSFDAFMALSRRRRSTRWFEDKPVDLALIDQALAAAAQSPSACNRQPFNFRIFNIPNRAAEITAVAMGTKGFAHNVPAVAVVVGQLRAYPYERDRHIIYIDASLASMSFMYALETIGLASCPINWPDQEPQESIMKRKLDLADDERVVMLIAFGYPDEQGMIPYSSKRDVSDIRVLDRSGPVSGEGV